LLNRLEDERRTDNEAREALLAVLVRFAEEYRYGLREVVADELCDLTRAWTALNNGETPAEVMLRLSKRCACRE
jgi:hypothetical protein